MEEPLLSFLSPRRRGSASGSGENSLFSLPENEQVSLPLPVPNLSSLRCPAVWKERLIFGSVPPNNDGDSASPDLFAKTVKPRIRTNDDAEEEEQPDDEWEERSIAFERDSTPPGTGRRLSDSIESGKVSIGNDPVEQVITLPRTNSFVLDVVPRDDALQPNEQLWVSGSERRKNLHRSRTAPAMAAMRNVRESLKRPELDSATSIVKQAVIGLLIYLSLGVMIYSFNRDNFSGNETYPIVDALYFCIVTMCTIGYGDITPETTSTKLFACFFVLVGFGFIDILLSGMVTYVLDKQENLLLSTVEGSRHDVAKTYFVDVKKGRMRIRMKVALALGVVILCIGVGTAGMHTVEHLGWLDSFYLSVMSVTTVGYGDHAFKTLSGRLFASIWLLVSTLAVARAFLYLAEARIDKRHRLIAKWVLNKDLTIQDLLAADIDNNGFVSKSEYVIYKLKEMGKVEEKDIMEICKQFNRLDTDNCGKITLSYLLSGH